MKLVALPLAVLAFTAGLLPAAGPPPAPQKPNILIILSDDQGYGDVGVHGCKDFATPNLDSIARNGVHCPAGYVSAPQCAPSRCGLLTGRYQQKFGYEFNNDSPGSGLPLTETTIADRLRAAGYVTGAIGKWHCGSGEPFHPLNRGFTEFFGFLGGGHHYLPQESEPRAKEEKENRVLLRNHDPVPHTKYLTDQFGDEAVSFISCHAGEPWFLYLAFNAPHLPHEATPEYLDRVANIPDKTRRVYAAKVTALDDNVGRVLTELRKTGQEERTLIFFLSDNGGPLGKAWNGSDNTPFNGQKGDTLEGGIRVPFFVQWKGVLPAGKVLDQPVISLDIAPTALAASQSPVPPDAKFDGVNLLPALKGGTPPAPRTLYWRFNFPPGQQPLYRYAIRDGDWKYEKNAERTPDGTQQEGKPQLFDLARDPAEAADQSRSNPELASRLKTKWDAWNSTLIEPFNGQKGAKKSKGKKPQDEEH